MTLGDYPDGVPKQFLIPKEQFESAEDFPRFENIAIHLDLDTMSHSGGVITDDFDGDNLLDIFVSDWSPTGQMRLFHNNGDGTFTDRTEQANLTGIYGGLNTVQVDFDNDGDLDVFALRGAWLGDGGRQPNSILQNDGTGRFQDVTFAVGMADENYPTQTGSWADFDNDGDMDCFVGNESHACQLFRNDGKGFFTDIAKQAGVTNGQYTKGVTWGDFDNDRFPDLYVSNLGQKNRLYRNNRDGTFTDVAASSGVAGPEKSFGTWFWDHNNDGILDLYASSYTVGIDHIGRDYLGGDRQSELDGLYQGTPAGPFTNVAKEYGLLKPTQPMGCNFGDLDNDGHLDFYLATGYPKIEGLMPNVMYRSDHGKRFNDVTFAGGFGHLQKGHAVAFADLDHDGDQELFVELGGAYAGDDFQNALFENPGFGNNWIKIQLRGSQSNRFGVGARIKVDFVDDGQSRSVYRWVTHGSSFGANSLRQEIGVSKAKSILAIEIYWPTSDTTQTFENVDVNQLIEVAEDAEDYKRIDLNAFPFYRPG
ncbi:MAG: CRTAC1 family protein, partial [Pirellulaceae bacterium]|nr:CRTAC1 family protein [Pirellulaceae bacterium]